MSTDINAHAVALREEIIRRDTLSWPEALRFLEDRGLQVRGDQAAFVKDPNLIVWMGMSHDAIDVICGADDRDRVLTTYPATSKLDILGMGQMLKFPIASRPPRDGYKEPHWVPCWMVHVTPARRSKLVKLHGRWPLEEAKVSA